MNCNHSNPAGYVFCGTCGAALEHVRCRCGFVAAAGELFCGQCGMNLLEQATAANRGAVYVDQRLDLDHLAQQAAQEKKFLESSDKARVTQDDIRKLLTTRRKKF
jgi:hypothetical protein